MNSNRAEIEQSSRAIAEKYDAMLSEMTRGSAPDTLPSKYSTKGISYVRIPEISDRWLSEERPLWETMAKFFVGLYSANVPVSVVFSCSGDKLGVYFGTYKEYPRVLLSLLKGCFPQIRFEMKPNQMGIPAEPEAYAYERITSGLRYGGFLKGNPSGSNNVTAPFQIDSVIKGMRGHAWSVSIFAFPVPKNETRQRQQILLGEATNCSELTDISFSNSDNNAENVSYKKHYLHSEQYGKKIDAFCEKITQSVSMGEWDTMINFSSGSPEERHMLGGLLTSAFFGEKSEPEPVHAVYSGEVPFMPHIYGLEYTHMRFCEAKYPQFGTLLHSGEIAVYAAFPTVDVSGFTVRDHVDFDVNREISGNLTIGRILDSGDVTDNVYSINVNELNRHCLIVGLTGSGKTNTVKSLICESTAGASRPFMVIEPAKKEYWELYKLGYDNLQIYSVGSSEPNAHVFCMNPFERASVIDSSGVRRSVSIQTHIDFVFAAFKASFIMYTPMPYVLERSIYEIYEDCGWDIHKNVNRTGEEVYPTIEDLYYKIPEVVTDMGYDQKMRNDLIGSLQARINSMRLGTKGDTLNVRRSFPLDRLLQGNVVIELEDIGDDDVKAFIISLLLIELLEYRRQQEDCQKEVRHLMLIEEAHRLLKNVQGGTGENADPRGAAVEFFCNLLAELRSKGQGFIVADQIPSKLAPDLIKNTNLKIVHRTVAEEERRLIGGAMHMTEAQIDSLASLRQGVAAVYSEGDNRPKLVNPTYAELYAVSGRKKLSRDDVLNAVGMNCIKTGNDPEYMSLTNTRTPLCRLCSRQCRKQPEEALQRCTDPSAFRRFADGLNPLARRSCVARRIDEGIRCFIADYLPGTPTAWKDRYCVLNCLLKAWQLDPALEKDLIEAYMTIKRPK